MTRLFRRLSLPAKLVLIGTLPLIFLLVIAFQYHREKSDKLEILAGYRDRIDQAITINNLIDQLQTERRYSFGYNLKGTWQNDMLQQRTQTDALITNLENQTAATLPGFASYTFLDQLKNLRARIDRKELQPLEVMNMYTNAIFRLNTLNGVVAGNNVYLQPVIGTVNGQKILSDIITYKGIILSQIYFMLETKQSNPQLVASVLQLQDIINTYVKEFQIKAPRQRVNELEGLRNDFDVKTLNGIEGNIRTTQAIDMNVSSDFYWNISTKAIDKYKLLQRSMIAEGRRGANEIFEREKQSYTWTVIALIAVLIAVISFIILSIKLISTSLMQLKDAAEVIARGGTGIPIKPETNDAIGSLTKSILAIDHNNKQLSAAAKAIGEGNFDVPIHARSEEDILGNSLVRMKDNLQAFTSANEEKIWIQTGIATINDAIRGEKDVDQISSDALQALAAYMGCESGVLYTASDKVLRLKAGYAVSKEGISPELGFGETLIGQVAKSKTAQHLHDIPDHYLQIRSGLGTAAPKSILIYPLCMNEIVEGVVELASLHEIPSYKKEFVKEVASDIAIALNGAKSREQLQNLLERTQAQAEELQSQHSELENINAELEAQAEKLQASEEELKVQQEELMQTNQEMEERSRLLEERNQLIVEKNIEIQRKAEELELSTKYKSEFLANMSHELRTPLNSILLLSRLLSENNQQNLSPDQVEYSKVIQSSGQGLLSLIDEILDLSKIEAGKMELEFAPVMIGEIIQDMQALFAPMAKEKGLDLKIITDPELPSQIETDKMRLEQVLKNLLSNALKFTAAGSVTLHLQNLKENKAFVSFSVKDTGIGIPADKQALIFEAFQQADGSTRRKFGGTGLGLSISRELTKLLGGEIKVSSEPGKGSEFTIYIPVHQQNEESQKLNLPEANAAQNNTASAAKTLPRKDFRSENIPQSIPDDRETLSPKDKVILIIEDDTGFAKALLDFTHQRGYKGLVAVRGDEGIELAGRYKPIGILLDLQLPVKDGWEVMEALKSNPSTRHIPVHIMSSLEAKKESLVKGAVDFINKPVAFEQMQEVFKKIEQVLSKDHKKVLIVEENPKHAKALAYFLETFQVNTTITHTVPSGMDALKKEEVDCVILDMGLPDQQAYETLEQMKKSEGLENLPIIIFTGKNLSKNEELRIKQYADSIVIKTAHSYQRILDEVSLFLHLMEETEVKEKTPRHYKRLGALQEVLAGKKILVVDDDVRNIFSLTKALEMQQMQVISAVDGREALKQLDAHPDTQVVLMDIMMPEMDGYEAMQEIRKNRAFQQLPIIAVTAKAMTGDREKCIQAGASDYISKPVDIDQLLSLLRVWLYDKIS